MAKRNSKIKSLKELSQIVKKLKMGGKKIGLITGCFDILHIGHIDLFKFAKNHVDFLIVGLDNDESIKLTKGKDRPLHNIKQRSELIAELNSVDFIFKIGEVFNFSSEIPTIMTEQV